MSTYPDTTVLDIDTGVYPAAADVPKRDPQSIYHHVHQQPETSVPVWIKSARLPEKSEALGLIINGDAWAYPAETLMEQPVLNDSLGG